MATEKFPLNQIQRWMQSVITHPEGVAAGVDSPVAQEQIPITPARVDEVVSRSQALSSLERLQIYGNAYYARLVECLRDEFPALRQVLGEETFTAFAMGYLQSYPSQSYTLAQLGQHFPRFLEETRPDSPEKDIKDWGEFLVDLARLERLYSEVFDGPGIEGQPLLTADDLKRIPPEHWPEVRLIPVPCLKLATFRFPVHESITAVRQGRSPTIPPPRPTFLAVSRRDFVVRRAPLTEMQYKLLTNLTEGRPLGTAIASVFEETPADFETLAAQLQIWFQDWTEWKFFARVE